MAVDVIVDLRLQLLGALLQLRHMIADRELGLDLRAKAGQQRGVNQGHNPAGIDQRWGAGFAVWAGGLHTNSALEGSGTAHVSG